MGSSSGYKARRSSRAAWQLMWTIKGHKSQVKGASTMCVFVCVEWNSCQSFAVIGLEHVPKYTRDRDEGR